MLPASWPPRTTMVSGCAKLQELTTITAAATDAGRRLRHDAAGLIVGVAGEADIVSCKAIDTQRSGRISDAIRCMQAMAEPGVDAFWVQNHSWSHRVGEHAAGQCQQGCARAARCAGALQSNALQAPRSRSDVQGVKLQDSHALQASPLLPGCRACSRWLR
jgi:hypothetical protein